MPVLPAMSALLRLTIKMVEGGIRKKPEKRCQQRHGTLWVLDCRNRGIFYFSSALISICNVCFIGVLNLMRMHFNGMGGLWSWRLLISNCGVLLTPRRGCTQYKFLLENMTYICLDLQMIKHEVVTVFFFFIICSVSVIFTLKLFFVVLASYRAKSHKWFNKAIESLLLPWFARQFLSDSFSAVFSANYKIISFSSSCYLGQLLMTVAHLWFVVVHTVHILQSITAANLKAATNRLRK